ncbi:murein biosynthesis integral membrane protein MurJ [Nocardiopsis ansamitocini]|uniref:Membrane protein n=1 Tax=Nocardiopsis ansamitocini TaxID=1670832 RepID=A0A9W6P9B1_9ACTN|nr:lipid II flippase MurJ [Nocardiopsis ansamitocini]GLU49392.1 membrane protein [Nocardiopsis ansamitocini]
MVWERIRRASASLAGAAVLIGVVTAFARVAGFGRTFVFAQTVGDRCLGTAYVTANQLPTVLFEILIGGALAGMVVPVLATAARNGDTEHVRRTASALITWVVLAAVPLSLLLAVVSVPITRLLLVDAHGCPPDQLLALTARFLVVFAPQILFYGLAAVLYGLLQAHRRFLAPALAPLLSSLVVICAYLAFVPVSGSGADDIAVLPVAAELTLSLGTTLGVVALFVTALLPAARLRLRLRPTLRFPPGIARRVRSLAVAALLPLVAMQLTLLVSMWLANNGGGQGAGVLYSYAWALFTLPYGVVAVPIATSAFTTLSVHHGEKDGAAYDRVLSMSTRAVLATTAAVAAALAAAAGPLAAVFATDSTGPLAAALPAYAPGVVAFGMIALLSKALYAAHRGRSAAAAQIVGWLTVMAVSVAGVALAPSDRAVAALGTAMSAGLTVGALLLGAAVLRARGTSAFAGLPRALVASALGAGLGYAGGAALAGVLPTAQTPVAIGSALVSGTVAIVVAGAVVAAIDAKALRAALTRRVRPARPTDEGTKP